jgi:hypothetical protein
MLTSGFALIAIAALLAGAALQIVLALAGFRARRQDRNQSGVIRDLQKEVMNLQQDLALIKRQGATPRTVYETPAPVVTTPVATQPVVRREPVSPAYEMASKLARRGAPREEIMETCGLSRGEADLIGMLSRMGQANGAKAGA